MNFCFIGRLVSLFSVPVHNISQSCSWDRRRAGSLSVNSQGSGGSAHVPYSKKTFQKSFNFMVANRIAPSAFSIKFPPVDDRLGTGVGEVGSNMEGPRRAARNRRVGRHSNQKPCCHWGCCSSQQRVCSQADLNTPKSPCAMLSSSDLLLNTNAVSFVLPLCG